jgi:hypothetical protein
MGKGMGMGEEGIIKVGMNAFVKTRKHRIFARLLLCFAQISARMEYVHAKNKKKTDKQGTCSILLDFLHYLHIDF